MKSHIFTPKSSTLLELFSIYSQSDVYHILIHKSVVADSPHLMVTQPP